MSTVFVFLKMRIANGFLGPSQPRRPLSNYDNCSNNGVKHLGNIPGQINVSEQINPKFLFRMFLIDGVSSEKFGDISQQGKVIALSGFSLCTPVFSHTQVMLRQWARK